MAQVEAGWIVRIPSGTTYNDNSEYYEGEQPRHRTRGDRLTVVEFAYADGGRLSTDRDEFCVNVRGQQSHFFFADDADVMVREDHSLGEIHTRRVGTGFLGGVYDSTARCGCGEQFRGSADEIRTDHRTHIGEVVEAEFAELVA